MIFIILQIDLIFILIKRLHTKSVCTWQTCVVVVSRDIVFRVDLNRWIQKNIYEIKDDLYCFAKWFDIYTN